MVFISLGVYFQVYEYLLRLYLCVPDDSLFGTLSSSYDKDTFKPDLSAAFHVLGEQAGCVDAVKVFLLLLFSI